MSLKILKIVSVGLFIIAMGMGATSCGVNQGFEAESTPPPSSNPGTSTIAASNPSGQPTSEGHGNEPPEAHPGLAVKRVLSEEDLARLASATISDPFFSVMVEKGSDPTSENNWLPVGTWSSFNPAILFSSNGEDPSPYLSDICLEPYVRLTGALKMHVEKDGVIQTEYYQSPPVIQACPGTGELIVVPLLLERQCPDCGKESPAELIMEGILTEQDANSLSHLKTVAPLFSVVLESGPDPTSENDWTRVGEVSAPNLSIRISDASQLPPPHLKDFCIHPYLRLRGFYEVKIETGPRIHYEYYRGPSVIQQCPGPSESVRVSLPLEHQRRPQDDRGGEEGS